jgi:uncharacterized protein YjdB
MRHNRTRTQEVLMMRLTSVRRRATLLLSASALVLVACGGNETTAPPTPVASVTVSPATATVSAGATRQLTATTKDAAGNVLTGRTVTWASNAPGVATVSGTGLVTGVAAGTATITATSEGQSGTAAITVTATPAPVASVTVSPATATVNVGATVQLTATTKDAAGNVLTGRTVTWASSATGVATVSGTGLVTGVAAGTATITATSEGQSGTAAITVPAAAPTIRALVLSTTGGFVPPFGFLEQVQVCSDNTCNTHIANATVRVNGGAALSYNATNQQYEGTQVVAAGATVTLSVTVGSNTFTASGTQFTSFPNITAPTSGATWQGTSANTITWTAGAPTTGASYVVGVLDNTGNFVYPAGSMGPLELGIGTTSHTVPVNSLAAGSDQVFVGIGTTGIGNEQSGGIAIPNAGPGSGLWLGGIGPLVPITVTAPAAVASVTVTPNQAAVAVGQTVQLTATTKDAAGNVLTGRTVTWTTSNAAIATVSSTGLVTGVAAGGPVTITATSEGQTGTAAITVTATPAPVASVTVSPPTATVTVGATVQLTATTTDAAGNVLTGRTVTWTSDNTAVATVDATGLVTGVAAGTATITATSEGQTGTAAITVTAAPTIQALVLSTTGGFVPPFGFLEQVQVCSDDTCNTHVANATVTVNGVALSYNATEQQYLGNVVVGAGAQVTLSVTVGSNTFTASGTQFTSFPSITAPTSGATWQGTSANTISWTGGAPTTGASYVVAVFDNAGAQVYPAGGPVELGIGITSHTVPANTLAPGSDQVLVAIGTTGIGNEQSGGIAIPNAGPGSGLWLGGFGALRPVTVQ